jgi:hypothetical protein
VREVTVVDVRFRPHAVPARVAVPR